MRPPRSHAPLRYPEGTMWRIFCHCEPPMFCSHEFGDTERGCGNLAFAVGYTYKERSSRRFAPRDDRLTGRSLR